MNINVEVTGLDLDSVIGEEHVGYDVDGEPISGGPVTLRGAVVREVARQLVQQHGKSYELGRIVTEIREKMLREALAPIVAEAIETPVQRTNAFGEVQGQPVTMRSLVMDTARKILDAQVDSSGRPERYAGSRDRTTTYASFLIDKVVREVFAQELQAELDAAKEQLRGQLQQVAAAKLAEAVKV